MNAWALLRVLQMMENRIPSPSLGSVLQLCSLTTGHICVGHGVAGIPCFLDLFLLHRALEMQTRLRKVHLQNSGLRSTWQGSAITNTPFHDLKIRADACVLTTQVLYLASFDALFMMYVWYDTTAKMGLPTIKVTLPSWKCLLVPRSLSCDLFSVQCLEMWPPYSLSQSSSGSSTDWGSLSIVQWLSLDSCMKKNHQFIHHSSIISLSDSSSERFISQSPFLRLVNSMSFQQKAEGAAVHLDPPVWFHIYETA